MRTRTEAVTYARRYRTYRTQYCLNFVQTVLDAPWSGPSAVWAWNNATHKHGPDPQPPAGVPLWWLGSTFGHIALSTGGGRCISTDWPSRGRVSEVGIHDLARAWGRQYVGWSESLGGTLIPHTPPKGPDMPITDADARKIAREVWALQANTGFQKDGSYDAHKKRRVRMGALLAESAAWGAALLRRR